MNRALRAVALVAAIAAPAALTAQTADRPASVGVSGGLSLPNGDFSEGYKSGYSLAGHVYLKPSSFRSLRFRGDVSFDSYDAEDFDDVSLRSLGVVANALYEFPSASSSMVRPYVLGGLGLYNVKVSAGSQGDGDSWTKPGVQVGGGLNFQLSGFTTFAEAKFVNVFTEGSSLRYIPITFGVRF